MEENSIIEEQIETLETEVKKFADGLPYWAKFLAEKVLSGIAISEVSPRATAYFPIHFLSLVLP